MQMQSVQSCTEKVTVSGYADGEHGILTATCHPEDLTIAKEVLKTLYRAHQGSWSVEFQDACVSFWSGLHDTYGYRMGRSEFGKGMKQVRLRGQELIARIKAGAC